MLSMMQWRKVNFADVPDRSPDDVAIQWRFTREEVGSPALGVSRFVYEPGARMPFAHAHREQEEAYVVAGGSGTAWLDGEEVELGPADVLHVPPAVVRSFKAGPDGLDLLCVGAAKADKDNVGHPDPWAP
jgi:quercetin dioxygenase-like cupin family protein